MMYFATVYPGCAASFDLWCLLCLIVAFVGSPPPFVVLPPPVCSVRGVSVPEVPTCKLYYSLIYSILLGSIGFVIVIQPLSWSSLYLCLCAPPGSCACGAVLLHLLVCLCVLCSGREPS